jgi:hypothetical protein
MFALDQDLPQLAEAISEIHEKNWTSKNPFQKRVETVRRVSTILHGSEPSLAEDGDRRQAARGVGGVGGVGPGLEAARKTCRTINPQLASCHLHPRPLFKVR